MPFELEVLIIDGGDGEIKVGHHFYGKTEEEVYHYKREHEGNCDYFATAIREGRIIEELSEIDEEDLPQAEPIEEEEEEESG
jgi:hypothetical protein